MQVKHYKISYPNLLSNHNNLRALHLSDLHITKNSNLKVIQESIDSYQPKIILLTGDYVCYDAKTITVLTKFLERIQLPKFATLGNHDHWTDPSKITRALKNSGCEVLRNDVATLMLNDIKLNIIGIDDEITKNSDPQLALSRCPPDGSKLVLSHVADSILKLNDTNNFVLSGHTHGGQVVLPIITNLVSKLKGIKYLRGFNYINDNLVYISQGFSECIKFRLRAPREMTFFDFEHGAEFRHELLGLPG